MIKIGFPQNKLDTSYNSGYKTLFCLIEKYLKKDEYKIFNDKEDFKDLDLLICSIGINNNLFTSKCSLTMWETSKLSHLQVTNCNKHEILFLPSMWCKDVFKFSGVRSELVLFDAFISNTFAPVKFIEKDKLIIGVAFSSTSASSRTNINRIINCFTKAYDKKNDVELWIKCVDFQRKFVEDNIKIFNQNMSELELYDWYKNIDVFLCGSSGEGIGLMNLQSMACGRPLISHKFSTMGEYVNENNSFIYDYNLVTPRDIYYAGIGKWAEIDVESLIYQLNYIYNNRDKIYEKSINAVKDVQKYKEDISVMKFLNTLRNYV